jgi:hypothetical protein
MRLRCAVLTGFLVATPALASAQQPIESLGGRALGMGGAFVAVADDASATYWNAAGLATGGPAGATFGVADFRTGNQSGDPVVGLTRRHSYFSSLGTWPLGLSVARISDTRVTSVTGSSVRTQTLATSQYGLNLLQTVVEGLVVGANLKWVRGTVSEAAGTGLSAAAAFSEATETSSHTSNTFDLDMSVMVDMRPVRLGLVMKNLRQPDFTNVAGIATRLPREVRAGLSVIPRAGLTLALDMDLGTVDSWDGPRRMLAMGGEYHVSQRLVGRAGVRWNLKDDTRRMVYTAGTSVRVNKSLWLDTHATLGDITRDRGVGAALRVGF